MRACLALVLGLLVLATPAQVQELRDGESLIPPERLLAAWGFDFVPDEPSVADASPTNPVHLKVLYVRFTTGVSSSVCRNIANRHNLINLNSDIGFITVEAVGACPATQQASSGLLTNDLPRLQSTTDGWYDEVHAWRNQFAADFVQGVAPSSSDGNAGLAYMCSSAFSAFSTVVSGHAVTYMSGPHEVAHNACLQHNKENGTNPLLSFGYGWRSIAGAWRTVMSYSPPGTRIPFWSNPDVTCPNNLPCGTADANNARAWRERAPIAATWRADSTDAPAAPGKPVPTLED